MKNIFKYSLFTTMLLFSTLFIIITIVLFSLGTVLAYIFASIFVLFDLGFIIRGFKIWFEIFK